VVLPLTVSQRLRRPSSLPSITRWPQAEMAVIAPSGAPPPAHTGLLGLVSVTCQRTGARFAAAAGL